MQVYVPEEMIIPTSRYRFKPSPLQSKWGFKREAMILYLRREQAPALRKRSFVCDKAKLSDLKYNSCFYLKPRSDSRGRLSLH